MLNKQKSGGLAKLKFLLLVPLTGGLLFTSTMAFSKEYVLFDLLPQDNLNVNNSIQDGAKQDKNKKVSPPPPPAEPKVVKFAKPKKQAPRFPPPIVKPDKPLNQNVKFPPPIVRPNQPKKAGTPPPPPPVEPHGKNDIIYGDPTPGQKKEETVEGDPTETKDGAFSITSVKRISERGNSINKVQIALAEPATDGTAKATPAKSNSIIFKGTPQYKIMTPPSAIKLKETTLTGVKITGKAKEPANN